MRLIDADKIDFNEVFKGQSDFAREAREAAQLLIDSQPDIGDWIPVEDRLPNQSMAIYASVECRNGHTEVRSSYYRDGDFVNDQGCSLHKIIKAWKPRWIPIPYDPTD